MSSLLFIFLLPLLSLATPLDWTELKITWPAFDDLPMNWNAAQAEGWVHAPFDLDDWCDNQRDFLGIRYTLNEDISSMLLFNMWGVLSGIQVGTKIEPAKSMQEPNGPWHFETTANGTTFWTLSMYWKRTASICSLEPPQPNDELVLANSGSFDRFPLTEAEAEANTLWTEGTCFPTMGKYYWFNISKDTSCESLYPVFLMFNKGELNSWGWLIAKVPQESGSRWEHPRANVFKKLIPSEEQPACLSEPNFFLSTQHLYFDNPLDNFC